MALEIGGIHLSGVRPLETEGRRTSKLGHLRYRGRLGEGEVKVQQLASSKQARFVAWVSELDSVGAHFPQVRAVDGRFVVAEWVIGESLDWGRIGSESLSRVATLQQSLHATPASRDPGFDYVEYAIGRLRRFSEPLPIRAIVDRLARTVLDGLPEGAPVLAHADMTAANLVVTAAGRLAVIDNELLVANAYPLFDLFNVHRSFGRRLAPRLLPAYLDAYVDAGGDLSALAEHRDFFQNLWQVRNLGALLQAGALDAAMRLAGELEKGSADPHPLLSAAVGGGG